MAEIAQPLRVALAQLDQTVGDIEANTRRIIEALGNARDQGAQVVVFGELAVTGYPPEDLLLKSHFLEASQRALEEIAAATEGLVALVGYVEWEDDVYNSLAVLANGAVHGSYRKMFLPNYAVFDEHRYFQTGTREAMIEVNGHLLGLTICEDIWEPGPPATTEALAGATVIVNVSGSPYHHGKGAERERMIEQRARDSLCWVVFCNTVGGQDELVFDGHSLVVDHEGGLIARARQFEEELVLCNIDPSAAAAARLRDARHRPAVRHSGRPEVPVIARLDVPARHQEHEISGPRAKPMTAEEEMYAALVLGTRDYVEKNGFERALIGLSGGIDSALTACVAVDALGPDRVAVAVMPSRYSSEDTQADARALAANLGVQAYELPIESLAEAYDVTLADAFAGTEPGVAEENIQARIRGNLLMALSNKFGWLVLTTGNKSEYSVGYTTLYGDMAGGFAVLKDVPKTWVFRLARQRNERSGGRLIPPTIIERPPSAELRANQRDDDTLPSYEMLDPILEAYVEEDLGRGQMIRRGLPEDAVNRVIALVDRAEYKRRQAPPGIRISTKAFGRDRRMPITNRFGG